MPTPLLQTPFGNLYVALAWGIPTLDHRSYDIPHKVEEALASIADSNRYRFYAAEATPKGVLRDSDTPFTINRVSYKGLSGTCTVTEQGIIGLSVDAQRVGEPYAPFGAMTTGARSYVYRQLSPLLLNHVNAANTELRDGAYADLRDMINRQIAEVEARIRDLKAALNNPMLQST